MAQVMFDMQLERPEKRSGLIGLDDWLKLEETEAKAEAARLAEEPAKKKSKKGATRIEATTVVTGRPSKNNGYDGNDLLSYDEPVAPIQVDLGGKNWIGLLTEYRQANPRQGGPDYQESSPRLERFTCLVTIGERVSPLGDTQTLFTRKKDAKQYAAKLAIEWLIANHHMPSTDAVSFPKVRPQAPAPSPSTKASPASAAASTSASPPSSESSAAGPSYGQRVADMCTRLAMAPPAYVISANAEFNAMYNGYAVFENSAVVMGRVGEFWNVFGKKKAREACAEKVLRFLEGVAQDRAGRGVRLSSTSGTSGAGEKGGSLLDL